MTREAFLAEHPDLPGRISDLSRSIEARGRLGELGPAVLDDVARLVGRPKVAR